jgi:hypothetical protein
MANLKKCPYCAEFIKVDSIICEYCGRTLAKELATMNPLSEQQRYEQERGIRAKLRERHQKEHAEAQGHEQEGGMRAKIRERRQKEQAEAQRMEQEAREKAEAERQERIKISRNANIKKIRSNVVILLIILEVLVILGTIIYLFLTTSKKTLNIESPSPIPQATATIIRGPTLSAAQILATKSALCLEWSQLSKNDEGKLTCIYGVVEKREVIKTKSKYQFIIRFNSEPSTFYLTSDIWLNVMVGDCVVANSIVQYDINGVPFMKVEKIILFNYQCSNHK